MKVSGRAQFRWGEKCVAPLAPSQLVQFNHIRFSIPNRLAVDISVQDFVNWRPFTISYHLNSCIFSPLRWNPDCEPRVRVSDEY